MKYKKEGEMKKEAKIFFLLFGIIILFTLSVKSVQATPSSIIEYPTNISYNTNISELNYTTNEEGYCWYSLNFGLTNSTSVSAGVNFTSLISVEGTNTWIVYCNDTGNIINSSNVTFNKDTTSPTYSHVSVNNTINGTITNFSINVSDNAELNPNGMCIFSTNNTGVWVNETAVNFTTTPSWANVTKILNSIIGTIVGYRWYFNDTLGNTNSTPEYTLNTTSSMQITSITFSSPITLTGGTTKTIYIQFNFTGDVNLNSAQINISRSSESRISTSCNNNTFSNQFNCSITFQFYDSTGEWNINATIKDNSNVMVENSSEHLIINELNYVSQNIATITWTNIFAGTNNNEATNHLVLTNGGNQNYSKIEVKAYNSAGVDHSEVIPAGSFSVDSATGQTSGQQVLTAETYVQNTELTGLNAHGSSITQSIYFYVNVSTLRPDTYTSVSAWSIRCST